MDRYPGLLRFIHNAENDRFVEVTRVNGKKAKIIIGRGLDFIRPDESVGSTYIVIQDPVQAEYICLVENTWFGINSLFIDQAHSRIRIDWNDIIACASKIPKVLYIGYRFVKHIRRLPREKLMGNDNSDVKLAYLEGVSCAFSIVLQSLKRK